MARTHGEQGVSLEPGLDVAPDFVELGIDFGRQITQAGDHHQRNDCRQQRVFDQILPGILLQQPLCLLQHTFVLRGDWRAAPLLRTRNPFFTAIER